MFPSPHVSAKHWLSLEERLPARMHWPSQEGLHAGMQALQHYTEITTRFPSLAITERARIKRALLRYEAGQVQQAIAELEDEEVALRGYAEVHAALAAILYTDRPEQRQRAEDQWELANEFDHRYGDLQWVRTEKSWGPRLLGALQHFLALE
jgi:hypothetical protein